LAKTIVSITITEELLEKVDKKRGYQSRSGYIESMVREGMGYKKK
jgi:metal-responsive CopG/Arc/MetJ family transcriptional regulator